MDAIKLMDEKFSKLLIRCSKDAELKQCKPVGRANEFEIFSKFRHSSLTQSVERMTVNRYVVGSHIFIRQVNPWRFFYARKRNV